MLLLKLVQGGMFLRVSGSKLSFLMTKAANFITIESLPVLETPRYAYYKNLRSETTIYPYVLGHPDSYRDAKTVNNPPIIC